MTRSRKSALTAALFLATFGSSCNLFQRKPAKSVTAPPPTPAPIQQAPVPAAKQGEEQVNLPAPPQITPKSPDLQQQPPQTTPSAKLPSAPPPGGKRKRSKTVRETPPPSQEPAAAAPANAQAGAPDDSAAPQVPQLEQILTPEQQQAYSEEIDSNISKAEKTVAGLRGRNLNGEQKTYLARVRAFVDQAKEARKTDLFRAKNLAERASVLAEDLSRNVQ